MQSLKFYLIKKKVNESVLMFELPCLKCLSHIIIILHHILNPWPQSVSEIHTSLLLHFPCKSPACNVLTIKVFCLL